MIDFSGSSSACDTMVSIVVCNSTQAHTLVRDGNQWLRRVPSLWLLYKAIYLETDPNEAIHLIYNGMMDYLHNAVLHKHEQPRTTNVCLTDR